MAGKSFGGTINTLIPGVGFSISKAPTAAATAASQAATAAQLASDTATGYSTTNIQVAGVDEADVVKTDGSFIYLSKDSTVYIVQAYPAEDAKVVAKIAFNVTVSDLFISGDKLVVFTLGYPNLMRWSSGSIIAPKSAIMPMPISSDTVVYFYDVSDKTTPVIERTYEAEGSYVATRLIGDYVYLVTQKGAWVMEDNVSLPSYRENGKNYTVPATRVYYYNGTDTGYAYSRASRGRRAPRRSAAASPSRPRTAARPVSAARPRTWNLRAGCSTACDPIRQPTRRVRAWYQAAAAILQRNLRTGDVNWMLERARALFPSDALIWFYCGALHEMLATPELQMAMQSARTTTSFKVNTSSEQQEIERAAGFLSRALEIAPAFAEARLHRGHVSGLLGRHQSAVADLTEAAAAFTDKTLQYYAALFLGREQDLLGDRNAAIESFKQAARLFPRAQSPLLAESELARRAGDSAGALAALERLLALPVNEMARDNPWWWYNASHVEDADARLATWRALFGRGTPR